MNVPYVSLLLYVGGPHDGHTQQRRDLWLQSGDVVRCQCHGVVYVFCGRNDQGIDVVEYKTDVQPLIGQFAMENTA